jgi:hypothetical protein
MALAPAEEQPMSVRTEQASDVWRPDPPAVGIELDWSHRLVEPEVVAVGGGVLLRLRYGQGRLALRLSRASLQALWVTATQAVQER